MLSNECFSYIPDLRKLNIIDKGVGIATERNLQELSLENDFYTLIGLTEDEIQQVNNTVVNLKDKDISDTESIKSEQKSNRKKTKNVVENKGENDINKLTVPKLKELAKSRNIKIHSKIKKQELISLLNLY